MVRIRIVTVTVDGMCLPEIPDCMAPAESVEYLGRYLYRAVQLKSRVFTVNSV